MKQIGLWQCFDANYTASPTNGYNTIRKTQRDKETFHKHPSSQRGWLRAHIEMTGKEADETACQIAEAIINSDHTIPWAVHTPAIRHINTLKIQAKGDTIAAMKKQCTLLDGQELVKQKFKLQLNYSLSPHWQGAIWGGLTGGTRSLDPGPPPWVRGSIYKKKALQDPGPNTHTAAAIRKEVLTSPPPTPPPKKRGTRVGGGWGDQNRKIHRGIIFSPKMTILQGVRHPVPYLGVSYKNDPKKGGYMAYAPALDLTTLFEVTSKKMPPVVVHPHPEHPPCCAVGPPPRPWLTNPRKAVLALAGHSVENTRGHRHHT